MVTNYMRIPVIVKCNKCKIERYDTDVEKYHFKEVSNYNFEVTTIMDCECGGTFE